MRNNFVVYLHEKASKSGDIFYCGSGLPIRPYIFTNRNDRWQKIAAKYGVKVHVIAEGLNKKESLLLESFITREWKDFGMCEACLQIPLDDEELGNYGRKNTPESIEKMRIAKLGKVTSEETKQKLREVMKGKNTWMLGSKREIESIEKTAAAHRGIPRKEETKNKIAESLKKRIRSIDVDGNIIEYNGLQEAADATSGCRSSMGAAANGRRRTSGGFRWEWIK